MSLKAKIEAVLFLTDKPVRAQAIARIVNADVQVVRQLLLELIHDYENRAAGLEIAQDNGYIIQVRDKYASITEEFLPLEMPIAILRTLATIAIKQPVAQSEIIKVRGAGAYEHIRELLARQLVARKEEGRSPTLTTTKKFQEYFRLTGEAKILRQQLKKQQTTGQLQLDAPAPFDSSLSKTQFENIEENQVALESCQTPALMSTSPVLSEPGP